MSEQTIVGDSSPLIALAITDQLKLLVRLYRQVLIDAILHDVGELT